MQYSSSSFNILVFPHSWHGLSDLHASRNRPSQLYVTAAAPNSIAPQTLSGLCAAHCRAPERPIELRFLASSSRWFAPIFAGRWHVGMVVTHAKTDGRESVHWWSAAFDAGDASAEPALYGQTHFPFSLKDVTSSCGPHVCPSLMCLPTIALALPNVVTPPYILQVGLMEFPS